MALIDFTRLTVAPEPSDIAAALGGREAAMEKLRSGKLQVEVLVGAMHDPDVIASIVNIWLSGVANTVFRHWTDPATRPASASKLYEVTAHHPGELDPMVAKAAAKARAAA